MKKGLSRRAFIALAAAGSLYGSSAACTRKTPPPKAIQEKWIPAACWHNCGGQCFNFALVRNGTVIRQKTDDSHADSLYYPQQRSCVRGRSQRRQIFAPDRLKYPMKRVHWEPGTGGNRALRGKDDWLRITWDEALSHVASELRRVKETHGNSSILLHSWTEQNEYWRLLSLYGGFIGTWGTCSYGNWNLTPQNIGFGPSGGGGSTNDRLDYLNCELIVMFGVNSAWGSAGMAPNTLLAAKQRGTHFIGIDPFYNDTYGLLDAEWIPINPGSDTAFLLAVAHTLLAEDSEKTPLIDWEFLKKATIGFDAESMPEGEDSAGNFKDYLMGTHDGIPKDATWASERTGAGKEAIKALAHRIGCKHKVALLSSWGVCRVNNSDNFPQLLMSVGAMTGHMGKSGHMTGACCHKYATNHGYRLVSPGESGLEFLKSPVDSYINDIQVWDAVLGKAYNDTGYVSHGIEWRECQKKTADIRLIFHGSGNRLESLPGMLKGIRAHRKVEFVVTATTFFTPNAMYADIVLPVNTPWEREGGGLTWGHREIITLYKKVTDSLYESTDDQWIATELGSRLGIEKEKMYPFDRKEQYFNMIKGARVISKQGLSGGYAPLVTIREEDLRRLKVQGTPQEGLISIEQLEEQGGYQVERYEGDPYSYIAFETFREDPEKNPTRYSKSGKLEIYSKELARKINKMGYSTIAPIPTYIPPREGYEASFDDWERKIKGAFPYQLVTVRYIKRSHTVFDNIPILSEAFHSPVFISMADAVKLNIQTDDTVLISSKNGRVLRRAITSARVKPGVIVMLHGSRADYDENEGLARGGADNVLMGTESAGQGTTGFNSLLVNVCKYFGKALIKDVDRLIKPVL